MKLAVLSIHLYIPHCHCYQGVRPPRVLRRGPGRGRGEGGARRGAWGVESHEFPNQSFIFQFSLLNPFFIFHLCVFLDFDFSILVIRIVYKYYLCGLVYKPGMRSCDKHFKKIVYIYIYIYIYRCTYRYIYSI